MHFLESIFRPLFFSFPPELVKYLLQKDKNHFIADHGLLTVNVRRWSSVSPEIVKCEPKLTDPYNPALDDKETLLRDAKHFLDEYEDKNSRGYDDGIENGGQRPEAARRRWPDALPPGRGALAFDSNPVRVWLHSGGIRSRGDSSWRCSQYSEELVVGTVYPIPTSTKYISR